MSAKVRANMFVLLGVATVTSALAVAPGAAPVAARAAARAQEPVHWEVVDAIMQEAFEHSDLMENASWLTDVFGPRNAKSPSYIAAAEWARDRLIEYGLPSAHLEPYEFGSGYVNEFISVHMMAPQYMPIIAFPATWSAGTDGRVVGNAVYLDFGSIESEADLEPYRGQLHNTIVLTHPVQKLPIRFAPRSTILSAAQLDAMARIPIVPAPEGRNRRRDSDRLSRQRIIDFVVGEGALAIVRTDGRRDYGTVTVSNTGYTLQTRPWEPDAPPPHTELFMAAEHYNRILRILEKGLPVELELDVRVRFTDEDTLDYNVVAEIPGTDLANELVLLGGHLQANPAGTGATDDAAGVVVSMEVMRIFQELGIRPRRTVRVGLWGGHEMGVLGNRAHVATNFADVSTRQYKADYDNLSAYFNIDHGGGRIRGVSIMGNEVIRSIFSEWMKPLGGLGMSHLFTTGMQHEAYEEVGLPGYYFVQDDLDGEAHNHSNMDVYDRLVEEHLMANTVILATFVYHAAMRDEKLPRVAPRPW